MSQKYQVETNQGTFEVELDRPPKDAAELRGAVERALAGRAATGEAASFNLSEMPIPGVMLTPGELAGVGRVVKPMILPTAGAVAGGLAGGVTAPFTGGVVNPMTLGAAGAMGGEALNQALGITEKSLMQIGVTGAVPMPARGAARVINPLAQGLFRRAPGASVTLHEIAAERLAPFMATGGPSADQLYQIVAQSGNPAIPLRRVLTKATEFNQVEGVARELAAVPLPKLARTTARLEKTLTTSPEVPFQDVRVILKRIGDKISETRAAGGEEYGAWRQLWKATMEDLETAATAGNPAMRSVQALKAANAQQRAEFAARDLGEILSIEKGGIVPRPDLGEGIVQVNPRTILKAIQKDPHLEESFGPQKYAALVKEVSEIARVTPGLPAGQGLDVGSKRALTTAFGSAGMLGLLGFGTSGPAGATVGGLAGLTVPKVAELMGRYFASPQGRAFLKPILIQGGGIISPQTMSLLAVAATASESGRQATTRLGEFGREPFGGPPQ
ncbi:MAG: hypothetical protein HY323_09230 [Betaproteobacteria bacterium]|nr:hypothetical protein [Betaproteobacteria bacterium]